jgi:RNA-binding protein
MAMSKKQQRFLRTLAHDQKPVIRLGQNGLSENVIAEIETALDHHELIKIKLRVGDRDTRDRLITDTCAITGSEYVQKTGNTVVIFRQNKKQPVIILPGSGGDWELTTRTKD